MDLPSRPLSSFLPFSPLPVIRPLGLFREPQEPTNERAAGARFPFVLCACMEADKRPCLLDRARVVAPSAPRRAVLQKRATSLVVRWIEPTYCLVSLARVNCRKRDIKRAQQPVNILFRKRKGSERGPRVQLGVVDLD